MKNSPFFVDSNILISAKNDIYPFDVFPSFWEFLERAITEERLVLLNLVKDEILKGKDELTDWIKRLNPPVMTIDDQKIVDSYGMVSEYVYSQSSRYSQSVINSWFRNLNVADPWLIAAAIAYSGQIITNETDRKPDAKNRLLIPNIASYFDVPCIKITQAMRELRITL